MKDSTEVPGALSDRVGEKDSGARVVVTLGTKHRAVRLKWTAVHTREGVVRPVFTREVSAGAVEAFEDDQRRREEGSNEASINMIRVHSRGLLRKPFQLRVEVHRRNRKHIWFDGILRPGMIRNEWEITIAREPVRIVRGQIVFNSLGRFDDLEDFSEAPASRIVHMAPREQTSLEPVPSFGGETCWESGSGIPGNLPVRVPAPFQNYVLAWRVDPSRHRTVSP